MNLGFLRDDVRITSRKMIAVTTLASTSLAWSFFMVFCFTDIFKTIVSTPTWVYLGEVLFLSFGAISAIVGGVISGKVGRRKLLLAWIILGIFASVSLGLFANTILVLFSSLLLGLSLGLGYPSFTAYLADNTVMEERARVSGIVIFVTFVLVISGVVVVTEFGPTLLSVILVGVFLRAASYGALFLDPCERVKGKEKSWLAVLRHRDFSLYLFPWLVFNIATGLTLFALTNLPSNYDSAVTAGSSLHYLGAGIAGLTGGFAADRFGRKQPIILGLVMLGVSFAFLGLATSPLSVIVYYTISGVAWGFLIVIYLAVPGDVGSPGSREKFYALGITIPLIIYMGFSAISSLSDLSLPPNLLSPILGIILFLSIIPVLRAREVISNKKLYERRMKEHVDKIGKLIKESKRIR